MRSRIFLLGLFVVFSFTLAKADQLPVGDPIIKTGGSPDPPAPAGIITPSFSIFSSTGFSPGTSPCILMQGGISTESGSCFFENDITIKDVGQTITSLIFDARGIDPSTVTCDTLTVLGGTGPFGGCGVDSLPGGGGTQVTFNEGAIPFHKDFTLEFDDFPKNFTFGVTATVPEPATLGLFLSGLAAAFALRRARAKA